MKTKMLLAVVIAASPAAAGPHHDRKSDPWAGTPNVTQLPPEMPATFRAMQADTLVDGVLDVFGVTRPRVLPSGAPACGNVQSKVPPSRRVECAPVQTASNEETQ